MASPPPMQIEAGRHAWRACPGTSLHRGRRPKGVPRISDAAVGLKAWPWHESPLPESETVKTLRHIGGETDSATDTSPSATTNGIRFNNLPGLL